MGHQQSRLLRENSSSKPKSFRSSFSPPKPVETLPNPISRPTKPDFFQKIKIFIKRKTTKFSSVNKEKTIETDVNKNKNKVRNASTIQKAENTVEIQNRRSVSNTSKGKDQTLNLIKKKSQNIMIKDINLMRRNNKQRRRLSMFDNLGITSIAAKNNCKMETSLPFSITDQKNCSILMEQKTKSSIKISKSIHNTTKEEKKHRVEFKKTYERSVNNTLQTESSEKKNTTGKAKKLPSEFSSPLIKTSIFKPIINSDVSALLVSNYNDYLMRKKKNYDSLNFDISQNKATKELIKTENEIKMNLNYAEFEKETFQNRNETFSNDFNETMNYFRQEKSRQDLFLNKTSPKFKFLNTSNSQKSNTSISKTYQRRKKFETTLLFPQLGFVSPQNQSSNTFSKFYDKNQTSKADLCSSESLCNNYPKVFFSTEMKSILMDDRVKNSLHEKEMDTFIQPGERKHVNRFKNNKNLIFCKDKVIQIKKNDEESSPEREIKENSSETLFMRIIKSGMSPTNYFLNSCHEKK